MKEKNDDFRQFSIRAFFSLKNGLKSSDVDVDVEVRVTQILDRIKQNYRYFKLIRVSDLTLSSFQSCK